MPTASSTGAAASPVPDRPPPPCAVHSPILRFGLTVLGGVALGALMGAFGQCTSGTCPLTSTWWRGAIYGAVLGLLVALGQRAG